MIPEDYCESHRPVSALSLDNKLKLKQNNNVAENEVTLKPINLHVCGSCDKLQPCWSDVAELIDGLCQCELPRDPQVLHLGLIPEGTIKKENIYMFKIMTVAVKKVITRTG